MNLLWLMIGQHAIQIKSCADQCKMRKRLRKITERLALPSGLLSVESEVICIEQHALEQQPRLIQFFGKCLTCAR